MQHYLSRLQNTMAAFTDDGWFNTGDLGLIDRKGNVYIKGRSKSMLPSSNGQNIYPEEIECQVNSMPYVQESLVVSRADKFVALGIICIAKPMATVISLTWVIGLVTLISGIATFLNWTNLRRYFPQSGSLFLSSMMQILIGVIFLRHDLALASILPLMFAFFLIIEGVKRSISSPFSP